MWIRNTVGVITDGKTEMLGEKPVPLLLCAPQIQRRLPWGRNRASAVRIYFVVSPFYFTFPFTSTVLACAGVSAVFKRFSKLIEFNWIFLIFLYVHVKATLVWTVLLFRKERWEVSFQMCVFSLCSLCFGYCIDLGDPLFIYLFIFPMVQQPLGGPRPPHCTALRDHTHQTRRTR